MTKWTLIPARVVSTFPTAESLSLKQRPAGRREQYTQFRFAAAVFKDPNLAFQTLQGSLAPPDPSVQRGSCAQEEARAEAPSGSVRGSGEWWAPLHIPL